MWNRTEAAARTRSDVDFAFFSTALSRRREIVWNRTEAAARTRSDADFAFFSIALTAGYGKSCGLGRKLLLGQDRTRTSPSSVPPPAGGGKSHGLGLGLGLAPGPASNRSRTETAERPPPLPPPDIILSFPSPSPQPPLHAHRLTSRGMMMGLPVKGHPPRRVHQLPVAKGTGATVAAAPTWKRTLPAPSGIVPPLDPPRRTVTCRGRVYLVGGDTVEVVAWTLVLAPPDPTNIPSPTPFFPSLLPTTATTTQPLLFSSLLLLSPPPPHPSFPVPCLLSLNPLRGQVTPGHRPSKHMVR